MATHRRREPAPNIFRLVLPLPFPGLDRVNAYALNDAEGVTLVDCGIRDPAPEREHGWLELVDALAACDLEISRVARVVVTHPHIDHYGLAARLIDETGCELWMHETTEGELRVFEDPADTVDLLRDMFADHGVGAEELGELTAYEDWRSFISGVVVPDKKLRDEETFDAAGRAWTVVYTPGHSRAHVCLWTAKERILISGDHLLPAITPHIDFKRGQDEDPLGEFLDSLRKVEALDPALVFPGHGRPFEEGAERARINIRHHDRRLGSILQVIRREPHTASEITDEIFGRELLHFERRLALGEALAHLAYLLKRGEIERLEREDGTFLYRKVDRRIGPR